MTEERLIKTLKGVVLAIPIAVTAFLAAYTIDAGERGVLLRNGAVIGVAPPGLGFKIPYVDTLRVVSVQTQKVTFDKVEAYSKDQQPADMTVSVNYRAMPEEVDKIYTRYGSLQGLENRLITPRLFAELKNVFGQFTSERAIRERASLSAEVNLALIAAVADAVTIEGVQIENIDFSDAFETAVEERAKAEVEVARVRQNAEREKVTAEITVTKAKANADAVRAEAQATADGKRMLGEAEAQAIAARGKALRDNPGLIDLVKAERWDGKLPTTMVPNGTTPMLSLPKEKQ